MTVHQLYDGGPANSTIQRTQWPAYPFSPTDSKFAELDFSVHNHQPLAGIRRRLDFKNDWMLRNYFNNNTVAAGDVLNLIVIPPKMLLVGLYVEVEQAQGGLNGGGTASAITATFGTYLGTAFGGTAAPGTALNLANVQAVWSNPNIAWSVAPAAGTVGVAAPMGGALLEGYGPDCVQMTMATLANSNLPGFGLLQLNVTAVVASFGEFVSTNF
jgi:hypothetical protein